MAALQSRRKFLKFISLLAVFPGIMQLRAYGLLLGHHKVSWKVRSKLYPNRIFSSVKSFRAHHPDPIVLAMNKKYLKSGLLLRHEARLVEGGRTLCFTKEYSSQSAQLSYHQEIKDLTGSWSAEWDQLKFNESREHLF